MMKNKDKIQCTEKLLDSLHLISLNIFVMLTAVFHAEGDHLHA